MSVLMLNGKQCSMYFGTLYLIVAPRLVVADKSVSH